MKNCLVRLLTVSAALFYLQTALAQIVITDEQMPSFIAYRLQTFGVPENRSLIAVTDLRREDNSPYSIYSINQKVFAAHSISQVLKHEKLKSYKSATYICTNDEAQARLLSGGAKDPNFKKNLMSKDSPVRKEIDKCLDKKYRNYKALIYLE